MFNLLFNKFFIIMKKISAKLINLSCLEGAADPKNLEGGNAYFFYTLQWWPTCRKQTQITNEWCIFICRSNFINSLRYKIAKKYDSKIQQNRKKYKSKVQNNIVYAKMATSLIKRRYARL